MDTLLEEELQELSAMILQHDLGEIRLRDEIYWQYVERVAEIGRLLEDK